MNVLRTPAAIWPWVVGIAALTGCAAGSDDTGDSSLPGPQPTGCDRADAYDQAAMTADLAYLASPELDGRAPGSEGDELARAFVADRFACLGLTELGTGEGFLQRFTDDENNETANVLGMIPGAQPSVMGESVVISAHLDHFGDGWLGANDNASGVTALLAIAQRLMNEGERPDRTIVFAAFGAEETGFQGAERFMRRAPAELDLDMSLGKALQLVALGERLERGLVLELGQERASALLELADARPNEAGVAELKSATLELPDGTVLDVGTASTRAIRQAAATLRRARGAKRGRTVTRDEQAKSKALAKHLAGIPALAGARVDLIAMSKERGADVRIRVPLAALRTLGRALVAHTKAK